MNSGFIQRRLLICAFVLVPTTIIAQATCSPTDSLTVRNSHALAYHEGERVVMLFGGASEREVLGDLWAWDGESWRCISAAGPSPRTFPVLTYDRERKNLILFGGNGVLFGTEQDTATFLDDTWIWDSSNGWQELMVEGPSARAEASSTYDYHRLRVVLFGGYRVEQGKSVRLGDTWEWDGESWILVTTEGPPARNGTAMAYDGHRRRIVLFGGSGAPGETWEWDSKEWFRSSAAEVPGRFNTTMAFDEKQQVVIRFGGWTGNDRIGDTWKYDGARWTQLKNDGPPARNHAAMAYDHRREVLVLFGGHDGDHVFGDTWEWVGSEWLPKTDAKPRLRVNNGH